MFEGLRDIGARYREAFAAAWQNRHSHPLAKRRRSEADFLPAVLEITESPPHPMAHITLYIILLFFCIALGWMLIGGIDIVAVAPGKILPNNRIKVVQAAQGGVVEAILVQDGDRVRAGDVLFELDITASRADETALNEGLQNARLEAAMCALLATENNFESPPILDEESFADIAAERLSRQRQSLRRLFSEQQDRLRQLRRERAALEKELAVERQGVVDSLQQLQQDKEMTAQQETGERHQIDKLRQLLPLAEQEYESFKSLHEEKVVSRVQMQQAQEKYISLQKDLQFRRAQLLEVGLGGLQRQTELEQRARQYRHRIASLQAKIAARRQSLKVERSRFRREMDERRQMALEQIAELRQALIKARQSREHHRIAAPAAGVVQQLAIHTQGAVVQAAQSLLVIVPQEQILEVEALVENKDIGFVREGQAVEIKVDAFPYTKYGFIHGTVAHLSPDAIEDEQRGLVYQAKIRLHQDSIVAEGRKVRLSSGMSVVAEIKTGERKVIEFFLSPLLRHGKESLGER